MSTDVDQGYFAWSQEELTRRDASTGVTISQMLDHGSVSFGKFEFESLSWEKWSVFRHDRRQEELEKFNGLVAEKRAYFEEYYKRMRALKALQQQQQQQQQQQEEQARQQIQQTELTLDYSLDGSLSEEEQETEMGRRIEAEMETGRKIEAEMETGMVVEPRRKDSEGSTVVENSGAGDTKLEMPIVGDAKGSGERGSRLVTKKLLDRRAISKEPSSSTRSHPGPKQNSKSQTRPVVHKPQPPPPPPPRKIIRKADNTNNLKVRTKEATRTIPAASIASTSTVSTTKRPSSSASMHSSRASGKKEASRTIPVASIATTSSTATTKRPSSSASMRRPLSSSGNRPSSTPRRPLSSSGDRGRGVRERVQRPDLSSNRMETITHGKMGPSIHSTQRMNIIPSTVKSVTAESRRQVSKEPLVLNNNTKTVQRAERYTLDAQKLRSVNLPPKKNPSTSGASETFSRNKNKEAPIKTTTQPRSTARNNVTLARSNPPVRNTALSHTESNKIGTPRKPIPARTSETPHVGSRHHTSSSSVGARKPKAETKSWR